MEHKARTKALSWLLSLALMLSLMPGMGLTAYAAGTVWSESFTTNGGTIDGSVTVSSDITLTIPENVTLTVNGGINANDKTLTVAGKGRLIINGAKGNNGVYSDSSTDGNGKAGGYGFAGNIIVDGATVIVTGGTGGIGGNDGSGGWDGGSGGNGVEGNVTVNSGSIGVTGGTGGNGGGGEDGGGTGGNGGIGVNGTVTVTGGSATLTGGIVGEVGTGGNDENGVNGKAVSETITGLAEESDDNSNWAAVSGSTSTKQYVKVTAAAPLDPVASVTPSGGSATEYTSLSNALTAWNTAGAGSTLKLLADVETTSGITVNVGYGNPMILDLNGYGIRYTGSSGSVINIGENGNLKLTDSDTSSRKHYITLDENGRGTAVSDTSVDGAIEVTGGYITGGNNTNSGMGGGGVCNRGTFNMSGGTIAGNKAYAGGGVCNYNTFNMSGGSIADNTATYTGGGVINYEGTFTLSGGRITGNYASSYGGGVFHCVNHTFRVSGAPQISGNTVGQSKTSNVHTQQSNGVVAKITIGEGGLVDGASIGVTMYNPGVFTTGSTDELKASDYIDNFTSDNGDYEVEADGNELKLAQPAIPYQAASWDSANNKVTYTTESCTSYTVVDSSTTTWGIADTTTWYVANSGDIYIDSSVSVVGNVNLILCDGTNICVSNNVLNVSNSSSLTVYGQTQGSGKILVATPNYSSVPKGSQFTLNGGQVTFTGGIQGSATVNGGKMDVSKSTMNASVITGSVVLNGGMLTGSSYGGYVVQGDLELNGGTLDIDNIVSGGVIGGKLKTALSGRAWAEGNEVALVADTYQTPDYTRIQIPVLYNLWVGGVRVTKLNAADVFGDGSVSYDDQTHTLALNNYSYSGVGYKGNANMPNNSDTCGAAVFYDEESPLTIALTGENRLVSTADGVLGIGVYSGTSLTIKGSGSLTAAAPGGLYYSSAGICINSDSYNATLTLQDGCTVTAAGGDRNPNAYSNCYGIAGSYDFEVRIENATVNVFGGHKEGYGVYGSVALTNGSLTAEGTYRAIYNTLTTAPGFGIQVSNESFDAAVPSDDFNYKKFVKVEPLPDGTVTLAKEKLKVLDGQDSKSAELAIDVRPTDGVPGAVSWSATSADGGEVALYSDASCTTPLSADDTAGSGKLYIRGVKPGTVTLAFTNTVNDEMHASCVVTVLDSTRILTVYEGEDTNESVPIYQYPDSQSQFVIPASQLTQMKDAIITGMTFYADTDSVNWYDSQYEVYMAEVEETTLTDMLDWTDMTRVREAACVSLAEGEMSIELSAPYAYNGGNLLIGFKQTTSGYCSSSYSWIGTQVSGASYGGYSSSWQTELNQQNFIPKVTFAFHKHSFTYSSNGTVISAHCANEDGKCLLPDQTATLTIVAPAKTTYGDANSAEATITDANNIKGEAAIQYQTKTGGAYGAATTTAPTNAGDHKASITVGGATASVGYTIAKADPTATAPTGLTATYGETLADVTLTNPDGNTDGTWAWADDTQSVGNVVSPAATFKANFTPDDAANYNTVSNVDVAVTVNKAANPATVASTASVAKGGNTVNLSANVTMNGATGAVSYEISGDAKGCSLNGSVLTSGENAGSVTVNVSVAEDDNYNALTATPITVTVLNYTALTVDNAPTISGGHNPPQVGDTLTANTTATDLTYQWYRGDVAIEGATSASYTAVAADVGKTIKVTVTQTKDAGGTAYAEGEKPAQTSEPTAAVVKKERSGLTVTNESLGYTYASGTVPTVTADADTFANQTPVFYYSTGRFTADMIGTNSTVKAWSDVQSNTSISAGEYYVAAYYPATAGYEAFLTPFVMLKVAQGTRSAPSAVVSVDGDKMTATLADADKNKALEYAVDSTNEDAWTLVKAENGVFPLGALSAAQHTIYLRQQADVNYLVTAASDGFTFNLTKKSVSYNANGGTGAPDTQISTEAITVNKTDKPTRNGYTFDGWYTAATGGVAAAASYDSSITLYAHWTANTYKVKFNANGGTATMADQYDQDFTYDASATALTTIGFTAPAGKHFAGWATSANGAALYSDGQKVKNLTAKANGVVNLYAVWAENVFNVSITVNSSNTTDKVTLKLMRGSTVLEEKTDISIESGTKQSAVQSFNNIPAGTYNVVATQGTKTMTVAVILTNVDHSAEITMPTTNTNSTLTVAEDARPVVVDGLAAEAASKAQDSSTVTVDMSVTKQEEQELSATATEEARETQAAIESIKEELGEPSANQTREVEYMNIDLTKRVTPSGGSATDTKLTETTNVITVMIPYDMTGKSASALELFRYHNGEAQKLTKLDVKPTTLQDSTYYLLDNFIYLYTNQFSTYAISYTETTSSHSYSSGGSAATYAPTVSDSANGTVSISPKSASSGTKVTITAKPNEGYEVDTVTVTDANGKTVAVTKNADGTYTFTQPSGKVKVDVTFKAASGVDALAAFSDVNASDWYAEAVRWALDNGVMNGVSPKYFNPNGDTTRAMVVTMLWRMEGSPAYAGASEFTDVDADTWYTEAVRWASTEGIVTGYDNPDDAGMIFNPNGAVTREQLATMLYRYAQYKKADVSASASLSGYGDASGVSVWATSAMQWAVGSGIINGIDSNLAPVNHATRAQVATMLMRYSTAK